jgi:hypothetical protein
MKDGYDCDSEFYDDEEEGMKKYKRNRSFDGEYGREPIGIVNKIMGIVIVVCIVVYIAIAIRIGG